MLEREELQRIKAEEARRTAAGLQPDPVLARRRGAMLGTLLDMEGALKAFDEAEQIRIMQDLPVDPAININRGCALRDMNRLGEALAALERAEKQYEQLGQPPHPALAVNLGGVLRIQGRPDEALLQYDKALQQSMEMAIEPHYTIFMNRGTALYTLGRYDDALACFEQAEQQRAHLGLPPDPLLLVDRGGICVMKGLYPEALRIYDEAESLCREIGMAPHPSIALNRGHALVGLGRFDEAFESLDECLRRYHAIGAEVPAFVHQRIAEAKSRQAASGLTVVESAPPGVVSGPPALGLAAPATQLDAFISHRRRDGGAYARLIKLNFEVRGRHAFLDVDEKQPSSRFDERLLHAIEEARTFVLLLTPGALDRCVNEGDWLRREICHALDKGKIIVPVMLPDFRWPRSEELPEDIRSLTRCEGLAYSHDYFPAFMDTLVSWCGKACETKA